MRVQATVIWHDFLKGIGEAFTEDGTIIFINSSLLNTSKCPKIYWKLRPKNKFLIELDGTYSYATKLLEVINEAKN